MGKAVLTLDKIPESCLDCKLNVDAVECTITHESTVYEVRQRRDDCPLRPMPEKYGDYHSTVYGMGYERGWNDCLTAIEGSGEDGA